ncbi:MAG: flagellar filament capping protein FliD [Verrucomicrobia bacterium]|nr:flagellar filament capping protein FliD [Verrucomicrobiota bacterium]MBT5312099.1 flagellar filament capping protein FliD [Verrucomicrobiota bacterium]
MELGLSGLASGFDWKSVVDQLVEVERAPQRRAQREQYEVSEKNRILSLIKDELGALQNKSKVLKDSHLYQSRTTSVSDSTIGSSSVSSGAALGNYEFEFFQKATTGSQRGGVDAGKVVDSTAVIGSNGFGVGITTGTITINDEIITVETTDTLATLFTKVTTADSDLSMAYDTSADKITLASSSGSVLVLGSSNDTSNFLVAARLNNNGTSSVTSSYKLGGISQASELSSANFNTTLVGNSGSFRVNGETVTWSSSDSVGAILASITQSGAGVVASYDGVNDRFLLSNNTTGDIGISLEDVQGNFLQATKLASEPINANGAQSASTSVSVNNSAGYATGASSITVDATSAALSNGAKIYFENGGIFTLDADATLGATTLSGTLTGATLTNDETGYKSGTFNISSAVSLTSSAAATAKSVQINYSSGYANGATSLAVDSLGAALSNGDVIRFGNGATFTLSANAAQNAATLTGTLSGGAVADDEVGYLVQNITVGSNSNDFTTGDKVRFASGGILTLTADPASGATTLTGSLSADLSSGEATVSRSEAFLSGQVFQFANGSKLTLTAGVAASSTSLTGYWDSAVTNTEAGDQAQLSRGNDILYSLNGGDILTSHTNTITEESSGVSGLSVTGDVTGSGIRVDAVDTANNAITTTASHGLSTGDIVRLYTPATLMGGVSSKTAYYVRALSSSRISLHTSSADATAGSNTVDVTGAGTGDQYILGAAPPSFSVTVSADVGKVKEAVKDFVGQISKTQSLIGMHTTVKSDSDGKVEAGRLSNDRLVNEIAVSLRKKTMGEISGSGSSFDRLSDLGFTGNGYDNQISLTDENALDTILREKMGDLEKFFSTETVKVGVDGATADYQSEEGLAEMMEDYTSLLLGDVYGTEGALEDHRDNYAKEIDRISKNITDLERRVQFNKDQLTQSFIDMEMAQAKSNQEMQFLTQRFGG